MGWLLGADAVAKVTDLTQLASIIFISCALDSLFLLEAFTSMLLTPEHVFAAR